MGHVNISKLARLLIKLHKSKSGWLCVHPRPNRTTSNEDNQRQSKLVRSNGSSEIYNHSVTVSELTKDFPKHEVCRADLLYIGTKTPVLSETEFIKLGLNYFLLPSEFFKNDLTFLTIAAMKTTTPCSNGVRSKAVVVQKQPFLIQKGETGERLRIRVSEEFMSGLLMEGSKKIEEEVEEEEEEEGRVCTTVKLKKDYVQLVGLRKWKPKLETIKETKAMVEKKKNKEKKRKRFNVMKKKNQSKFVKSKNVEK